MKYHTERGRERGCWYFIMCIKVKIYLCKQTNKKSVTEREREMVIMIYFYLGIQIWLFCWICLTDSIKKTTIVTECESESRCAALIGLLNLFGREREKERIASGWSAGLVIERLRVQIPAGAVGEFSSPESTFCADSYSVVWSTPMLP